MEITVKEISQRLAAQAASVAAMLLPGGKNFHGKEWLAGDVTGAPGDSLKVCIHGTYAGQWKDWANDSDHGDLLDLWRISRNLTPGDAVKAAKEYLGIRDSEPKVERKAYAKPPPIKSSRLMEGGNAMRYLVEQRKLTPEIVAKLRIEGSREAGAIVFPVYSPSGDLLNRSYRTLDAKKQVWQDKGCPPGLFGWQALPEQALRDKTVLLSEGQIDCATWLMWGIPALSIPNGSGCAWIDYEWDNLAAFDTFYLAFDQDDAGRKITENVIARLGKHRCLIVDLPKKDANDCLLAGFTAKDAQGWVAAARIPKIKKLVSSDEMEERLLARMQPRAEPFSLAFMRRQWPHTGFYFRPGEVTIWAGYTGVGKSTILNFMTCNLIADSLKTFIASLEQPIETMLHRLAIVFYGENVSEDIVRTWLREISTNLTFADVVGSMKQADLMEMMWFSFRRYGTQHFIIDSLMRIEGLEEDYDAQGQFLTVLQNFVKETGSHVHLVAHLGKPPANGERPTLYSVKGSSLIVNNADNVLLVSRNPEREKLRRANKLTPELSAKLHDSEVIVEKQRDTGWLDTFRLKFNPRTYSYQAL